MKTPVTASLCVLALAWAAGCRESAHDAHDGGPDAHDPASGTHVHDDGTIHDDHAEAPGHAHDEVPLGTAALGDLRVECAQGHGAVEAGKEGHLVVKLPYSDGGATIVRAWIGTDDRTLSFVGKGEYAPSHDDYDIHATAPDPLPDNVMWWIEVEQPDGTKAAGAVRPILEQGG